MKVNKVKTCPFNDRFEKKRQKQKLIYQNYDFKNKKILSKDNIEKKKELKPNIVKNTKTIYEKQHNNNIINKQNIVINNNVIKKIPDLYFNTINSSNFKITKDDILKFEKNEEQIFNNLLKGIEELKNGNYIINANYILHKKYSKDKQSIITKESDTMYNSDKNNNTTKSIRTNKTLSKRNSKENNSKKEQREISNNKGKRKIKIVFPINQNDSKTNNFNKLIPNRLKYKKEINENIEELNFFPSHYINNKKELEDISLWDISSIKSNQNSYITNNSKNNISMQNSLYDFIK